MARKHYYKECKSTKEVNAYLKKIGLGEFEFDLDWLFRVEFDFDSWINPEETKGVSIQITPVLEVFVTKYTKNDIKKLEKEAIQRLRPRTQGNRKGVIA